MSIVDNNPLSTGVEGCSPRERRLVYVSRDFYATMDSQLSVFCDDSVELLSDNDKYWWLVRETTSGQMGYIPSDIIESLDEHEAKLNRQKNLEITRLRDSDLSNTLPWRNTSNESLDGGEQGDVKPWSRSGFARKMVKLSSAPATAQQHKKSVSFSETKPIEHHFTVEDSASCSSSDAIELNRQLDNLEIAEPSSESTYCDHNFDPMIEELLMREFGRPETTDLLPLSIGNVVVPQVPPPTLQQPNNTEVKLLLSDPNNQSIKNTKHSIGKSAKSKRFKAMISKFWRGQGRNGIAEQPHDQLLRIYAGNFTCVHGYKTLLVDEGSSMAEVADKACEKFGLVNDGFDYMLSVVHYDSHEILQVSANYSLAIVIELAKRATLIEGDFAPATDQSISRLSKVLRKQQSKKLRTPSKSLAATPVTSSGNNYGFSCLASPITNICHEELARDRESDFVTHYKFVLNRWLEGPAPTTPFYLRVQMVVGNSIRGTIVGVIPESSRKQRQQALKSPSHSPLRPEARATLPYADDIKMQGVVKMLVNTSMSVVELSRSALVALDISQVPGIKYDLYLVTKPSQTRDRIYLTKDMVVHDILHLRPMLDPSGLVLVLQPVVDAKTST